MNKPMREFRLIRKDDQVLLKFADGGEEVPVRMVWVRPISGRGLEVSLLDEKKKELLMLRSLDALDEESREIAVTELQRRYLVPRIVRVLSTSAHFGNRYWDVDTDRGRRKFVLRDPNKNATWLTEDHLLLRDTTGNCYEVNPFSGLDRHSKEEVWKIV